jgi:hypothetical protein
MRTQVRNNFALDGWSSAQPGISAPSNLPSKFCVLDSLFYLDFQVRTLDWEQFGEYTRPKGLGKTAEAQWL